MRIPPNSPSSPLPHPTLTSPAKPLISKAWDFSNEIKDLSGGVKPPANLLKTNNNIFSNKIKHLQRGVKLHANTLKTLENILYCKNNDLHCILKPKKNPIKSNTYSLISKAILKIGFFSMISNTYSAVLNLNRLQCGVDPQPESHPVTICE